MILFLFAKVRKICIIKWTLYKGEDYDINTECYIKIWR